MTALPPKLEQAVSGAVEVPSDPPGYMSTVIPTERPVELRIRIALALEVCAEIVRGPQPADCLCAYCESLTGIAKRLSRLAAQVAGPSVVSRRQETPNE